MKVSKKVDYGVRALMELAQHYGNGVVQSSEIARRQQIPEPYLDQLLTVLRKSGLIRSRSGPQGGHALAKPANEITLAEVVISLEGTIAPISCLDMNDGCSRIGACAPRDVWQAVEKAILGVLNTISIQELVTKQQRLERGGMYYI